MKYKTLLWAAAVVAFMTAGQLQAKNIPAPKLYVFGFAATFSDSIVHFTDMHELDSAWVDSKTEFLLARDNYSYQLRDYLAQQLGLEHRTCIIIYDKSPKKLEKKFVKMQKLYTEKSKSRPYDVRYISERDFRFKSINMNIEENQQSEESLPQSKPKKKPRKRPSPDATRP